MKKFLAATAFAALLVPAFANAASVTFDPGANNASPTFVQAPTAVNPANAAAAAADAQRYATVADGAVVGTHGAAPQTISEFDPGNGGGTNMVTKKILPGATATVAPMQYIPYAENSDVIGN